eukprot:NODE_6583_length_256_cov_54.463768_g6500_i0.p4 GENE.NODE_6583_length_256_cov_54.463768_g6500_i0~~NODE_6583_length_256_cov_54.463768_g6500_i0.p4  ORF type:complete len:50 (-),score=4.24 NODE_6583_length_256_cov_54.463768_g6500_i0:42-191(-)
MSVCFLTTRTALHTCVGFFLFFAQPTSIHGVGFCLPYRFTHGVGILHIS